MEPRNYQTEIVQQVEATSSAAVVALAPGAGKTFIAKMLCDIWTQDPNAKILWLTWLQNQLLEQTRLALQVMGATFSVGSPGDGAQATLALPQSHGDLGSGYSHTIIDEGHQAVGGKMVTSILAANPTAKLVVLTGTPNIYLQDTPPLPGAKVFGRSISEIQAACPGTYADIQVNLIETSVEADWSNWDADGKLDDASPDVDDDASLTSFLKSYDRAPTLWVCRNIDHATKTTAYLAKLGYQVQSSNSKNDPNSSVFFGFASNPVGILVTVNRGRLGTDIPALAHIVDSSGSHNVDLLFQLLCRGVRPHPSTPDLVKRYHKFTPSAVLPATYVTMSYVLGMSTPEYYLTPHGPVARGNVPMKQAAVEAIKEAVESRRKGVTVMPKLPLLPTMREVNFGCVKAIGVLSDVIELMGGRRTYTQESCKRSALLYQTRNEWKKGDNKAYQAAWRGGWLNECCAHMEKGYHVWTLDECKRSALLYQTRSEWEKGDNKAYQGARRGDWLAECCVHMEKGYHVWTLDGCKRSALLYQTRSEWKKGDNKAYVAAWRGGWLNECCAHMPPPRQKAA